MASHAMTPPPALYCQISLTCLVFTMQPERGDYCTKKVWQCEKVPGQENPQ